MPIARKAWPVPADSADERSARPRNPGPQPAEMAAAAADAGRSRPARARRPVALAQQRRLGFHRQCLCPAGQGVDQQRCDQPGDRGRPGRKPEGQARRHPDPAGPAAIRDRPCRSRGAAGGGQAGGRRPAIGHHRQDRRCGRQARRARLCAAGTRAAAKAACPRLHHPRPGAGHRICDRQCRGRTRLRARR